MDGKRILINPAGGLIHSESAKQWIYQRPVFNGIYIDSFTIDIAIPLADILKTVGMNVYTTRLLNKTHKGNVHGNIMGESQQPRYRECTIQYLKSIVTYENEKERKYIPPEIYSEGKDVLEQDANARLNYAKYIKADMMLTIDATTYLNDPGIEVICNKVPGSETLANNILEEVAKRTRSVVKGVSYAEEPSEIKYNSLLCPSVILKCGSTADVRIANFLTQGWWRQWVSLGCFAGIWNFLNK